MSFWDYFSPLKGLFGKNSSLFSPISGIVNLVKGWNKSGNGLNDSLSDIGQSVGSALNYINDNKVLENYLAGASGTSLTPAQIQANEWTAQREDIAWNRQLQASNTAYQRKVEDLRAAGLNPMLAAESGVQLPAASASPSASPSQNGSLINELINVITLAGQMKSNAANVDLIKAQANLANAQAKNANASTGKIEKETESIGWNIELTKQNIDGSKLDNYSKSVVNSYLDRMQSTELRLKVASTGYYDSLSAQVSKSIEKMDYEELQIFMSCCDLQESINLKVSQENLNEAQIQEISAMCKKLNNEAKLIGLNVDNFDAITVIGSSSTGVKVGPFSVNESSRPLTLGEFKEMAKKRSDDIADSKHKRNSNNSGRNRVNGEVIWD